MVSGSVAVFSFGHTANIKFVFFPSVRHLSLLRFGRRPLCLFGHCVLLGYIVFVGSECCYAPISTAMGREYHEDHVREVQR